MVVKNEDGVLTARQLNPLNGADYSQVRQKPVQNSLASRLGIAQSR